jgi:transcriptional regulator with XRE-family HTH domain
MAQKVMSLAQAMKDRGLTDETLAAKVGVSRVFITRIRNGKRKPSINVAAKLEEHTGILAATFADQAD